MTPSAASTGALDIAASASPVLWISVQLSDYSWLNAAATFLPLEPFWSSRLFVAVLLVNGFVLLVAIWAVWRATLPLKSFALAAERFGQNMDVPPIAEAGPLEVVKTAQAFNAMQAKLQEFIKGRTQMFAAISHDLRTPITRLRLRAELVEDAEQREKMLVDLAEMEQMIAASLTFARDVNNREDATKLNLAQLLAEICEAARDTGGAVVYTGPSSVFMQGKPLGLKRVFGNLIDNALKYGGSAEVAMHKDAHGLRINVDDHGPGIAETELEKVFFPFYRLDASRGKETGGIGLGLAIVRTIVDAHGGKVSLSNRRVNGDHTGGLRAAVLLPLGTSDPSEQAVSDGSNCS